MNEPFSDKRHRALDETDALPPKLRQCVHEFGYPIVRAMLNAGITQPSRIRMLVNEVWSGARQLGQASVGRRANSQLDWVLMQAGAEISAATLVRVLRNSDMVILPIEPMPVMVQTSMETVSNHNVTVTKSDKHRRRLRAAIEAGARSLWPQLR